LKFTRCLSIVATSNCLPSSLEDCLPAVNEALNSGNNTLWNVCSEKRELVFQRNNVVVLYTYSDMSSGIFQSAVEPGHNVIVTSH
jgi:hypothetical protein